MEEIIDKGESVIVDGVIITAKSDLPNEAQLAKGNKEAEKAAKASIKAQMEALEAQLKSLDDPKPKEAEVDEGNADENYVDKQAKEEEARKAEEADRAKAAVEAEKERKAEEEKKAASAKKEADKKA